jgi:hypothetical protein
MIDDDVILSPWQVAPLGGLALSGHFDARAWRFYSDRTQCLASLTPSSTDVLAAHAELLGAPLPDLVAAAEALDADNACGHILRLLASCNGVVRSVQTGIAGDSARYCPQTLMFVDGTVRDLITGDPQQFDLAMRYRESTRVATRLLVTHDIGTSTYCFSIDTSDDLPPFMANGRNEDGVFGAMLGAIYADALSAHLPFGIVHDSSRMSSAANDQFRWAHELRLADHVLAAMKAALPTGTHCGTSSALGRSLTALADLPLDDFKAEIGTTIIGMRARSVTALCEWARGPFGAAHLSIEAERLKKHFLSFANSKTYLGPAEAHDRCRSGEEWSWCQKQIITLGRIVTEWNYWMKMAKSEGI